MDVWPQLPLLIEGETDERGVDNVIAELKHSDRIRLIHLDCYCEPSELEILWTAMQVPFPELATLYLSRGWEEPDVPGLPDSFLGGSAPRLRYFILHGIALSGFPKVLLFATHLVTLGLMNIPHPGYISPETMAACLSVLTSLENLYFEFESPESFPDRESQHSFPPARSVLPALTTFRFRGTNKYLEDFVARIDTPRLCQLDVKLINDIDFDSPELIRFVSRSSIFKAPIEARVFFGDLSASVKFQRQASNVEYFEVCILYTEPNRQLSSVAQICTKSSPFLSTTENLFIY